MSRKAIEKNIYYDDVKDVYYVNLYFGKDENGKPIKKTKTFSKRSEARNELKLHEANKTKGTLIAPKDTTVKEWLQYWMSDTIKPTRAATTIYGYQHIIDNHIIPEMGEVPLQRLKASQVQHYYAKLARDKGLTQKTIRKHHDLLNSALKLAVKQDQILANPLDKVDAPKPEDYETQFYTSDQIGVLLNLIKGDQIEIVVYLAVFLGLRREEICGLSWKNVDMTKRIVYIKEVRTAAGSEVVNKSPKSKTSKRSLEFGDEVYDALLREQKRQDAAKEYLQSGYADSGLVAVWSDGRPYRPNYLSELFTRFIKSQGLPYITLHGLRHSYASIANAANASLYDISKSLGHSSTAITSKIYTHVVDEHHKQTLQKVAEKITTRIKKD